MSIQLEPGAQRASEISYSVPAPAQTDALGATLRCAYEPVTIDPFPFQDLIAALDRVDRPSLNRGRG